MTEFSDTTTPDEAEWPRDRVVGESLRNTLFEWTPQDRIDPIAVSHALGSYFWDMNGKRYLDLSAGHVCVNVGHGHPVVLAAIKHQIDRFCYSAPISTTTVARARLGQALREVAPSSLHKTFFTNGGTEANEAAIRLARVVTGRQKIVTRYRSYHGATAGALLASGDPRRWAAEPGSSVVRALDAYPYRCRWCRAQPACTLDCLQHIEDLIKMENPASIAAVLIETVVGTNGVLIPPPGYLSGLRELTRRHGILLICDEVMTGFGRTGRWFGVDHWGVAPDLMTLAKGLTSAYIPLGAVMMSGEIAEHFRTRAVPTGLTYNAHPVACAAALACLSVYRNEGLVENAARVGHLLANELKCIAKRHPCVGDTRALGLLSTLELADADTREPVSPPAPNTDPLSDLRAFLLERGVHTILRGNLVFVTPPLSITWDELRQGLAVIDEGLTLVDRRLGRS